MTWSEIALLWTFMLALGMTFAWRIAMVACNDIRVQRDLAVSYLMDHLDGIEPGAAKSIDDVLEMALAERMRGYETAKEAGDEH